MSRKFILLLLSTFLMVTINGCKDKKNNLIQQTYGEQIRIYKQNKEKLNKIGKEHLKKFQAIEDSLK